MFDLEQAISDWRAQMLAAGIKAPVPLEELECHLREEFAQHTKSALKEPEAFEIATRKLGQARLLNREFAKAGGFYDFFSKRRSLGITLNATKLIGWVWICLLSYIGAPISRIDPTNGKSLIVLLIFFAAFVGSVLLVFDSNLGRKIVRVVALIYVATWVLQYYLVAYVANRDPNFIHPQSFHSTVAEHGLALAFMIVSILVLHLPESLNLKTAFRL